MSGVLKDLNMAREPIHRVLHDASVSLRDLMRIIREHDIFLSDYDHDILEFASTLSVNTSELAALTRVRSKT